MTSSTTSSTRACWEASYRRESTEHRIDTDRTSSPIAAVSSHSRRRRAHSRIEGELAHLFDPSPLFPVLCNLDTVLGGNDHRRAIGCRRRFRRPHLVAPPVLGRVVVYAQPRIFSPTRASSHHRCSARRRRIPRARARPPPVELAGGPLAAELDGQHGLGPTWQWPGCILPGCT